MIRREIAQAFPPGRYCWLHLDDSGRRPYPGRRAPDRGRIPPSSSGRSGAAESLSVRPPARRRQDQRDIAAPRLQKYPAIFGRQEPEHDPPERQILQADILDHQRAILLSSKGSANSKVFRLASELCKPSSMIRSKEPGANCAAKVGEHAALGLIDKKSLDPCPRRTECACRHRRRLSGCAAPSRGRRAAMRPACLPAPCSTARRYCWCQGRFPGSPDVLPPCRSAARNRSGDNCGRWICPSRISGTAPQFIGIGVCRRSPANCFDLHGMGRRTDDLGNFRQRGKGLAQHGQMRRRRHLLIFDIPQIVDQEADHLAGMAQDLADAPEGKARRICARANANRALIVVSPKTAEPKP